MKTKVFLFLILTFFVTSIHANNVQLAGTVNIISAAGGTVTMEVDLSWDNSWRDDYNWDAAWLFFKYKEGVAGEWKHAVINAASATVTGGDYATMSGTTNAAVQGLFVYPSKDRGGNTGTLKVQVQWASSYTKTQFDNNDVFVVAHAIEMVYIPYGAYTIGDGSSANSFCDASGKPIIIDSEASIPLSTSSTSPVSPSAPFPKAYQGFYIMKYETSQEQYVEFLNSLTLAQQTALIPGVDALKVGDFVFGANKTAPNYRNGVVLSAKQTGKPLMFDNNLNNNKQYSEDGDGGTLAMNYMSISDAQGYASWAGLRPLTEMEYEKACRRPFPQEPDAGEYAWNSSMGAVNASGLMLVGTGSETVATGNVNVGNGLGGPARCGIFARPNTATQTAAGATYWGVMEMSGNVSELCANITNTTISKTGNGTGSYSTSSWGTTPTTYGTRGGGFSDTHTTLATSDRSAVSRFTNVLQRDSSVGFRCAYTYGAAGTVNPGTLDAISSVCAGGSVTISGTSASAGAVKITGYIWSVNDGSGFVIISGEGGVTLTYSNFTPGKTYTFKRKSICPLGEAEVSTSPVTTLAPITISVQPKDQDATCGLTLILTATGSASITYQWMKDGVAVSGATAATYTKASTTVADVGAYHCVVTNSCGSVNSAIVQVTMSKVGKLGTMTDPRDGKTYQTRVMTDGREWMIEDLKFGKCDANTFSSYYRNTTQNQIATGYYGVCIPNTQPDAGNLYNWQAAMNHSGAYYTSDTNPSGNVNANSTRQWQGICPTGWHLPSGGSTGEFQELYTALCSLADRVYPGTDDWLGVLGGYGYGTSLFNVGSNGYYWSSTYYNTNIAFNLYFDSNGIVYPQHNDHKFRGFAVRCVKNY